MTSPGQAPSADTDKPGLLPKRMHLWVVLGLSALLIGVTSISRSGVKKRATDEAVKQTEAEGRVGEDELLRRLREQTQRELSALEAAGKAQPVAAGEQPTDPAMPGTTDYVAAARQSNSWAATDQTGESSRQVGGNRSSSMALSYRQPSGSRGENGRRRGGEASPGAGATPLAIDELMRQFMPGGQQPVETGQQLGAAPADPIAVSTTGRNRSDGKDHVLFEGSVIETVLLTRLNGDFSGPVVCMVTTDLLSHDGKSVLVPAGSKVVGGAKKVEAFGQVRMAVAFHRLIMPDGYSVDLRQFVGLNAKGESALKDKVNNHYLQLFGASVAVGALGGLAPTSLASGIEGRVGIVPSLGQEAMHILDRFLNVLPSITIREGHRVRVFLTQDLSLPAYNRHRMPRDL